jgi:D-3-phosphoglycerate dehydrogenase
MYKILKLNKINEKAEKILQGYIVSDNEINPDGIIVRSYKMHDYEPGDSLLAVARAGAGVNNIPCDKFRDRGIVVFNTPGANANAVKELVICGMLLASRDIVKGINWTSSLKGRS